MTIEIMVKSFNCGDVGIACSWSVEADDTDELMKQIAEHANHEHDMQEIPYELKIKVESAIKDV